jgi:hypothetical protein
MDSAPYLPLPEDAIRLCEAVNAPPRLVAHLILVHDVAVRLLRSIREAFPEIEIDEAGVLFGAATHDLGKADLRGELTEPGRAHQERGMAMLIELGVPAERARFASTHGAWRDDREVELEDLLVSLADKLWKGKRKARLEEQVTDKIALLTGRERWRIHSALDEIGRALTVDANARLRWQGKFAAQSSPPDR